MDKPLVTIEYKTANGSRICVEVSTSVKELLEQSDRQIRSQRRQDRRYLDREDFIDGLTDAAMRYPQEADAADLVIRMESYRRLYTAVNKLSEVQRRRLLLHFADNLTQREIAEMEGINQGRDIAENKNYNLKDHILVIAPHEGLVSSEIWLQCRKRLLANSGFGGTSKAKNTWLSGKIKCGRCGAGLMSGSNPASTPYFRCRKRADRKSCEGCGTLRVREVEQSIYNEMRRKMDEFQTLTGGNLTKANPKLTALNVELAQVESEIDKLLNTLTGANAVLLSYANGKIEELDIKRQSLTKAIADMSAEAVSPEHMKRISGYLENWDSIGFEDRRLVVDGLISTIKATSESVRIEWKI